MSVYLHSSSSIPADLWSQSQYYISVTHMPVKILYPHCLVDPDLPSTLAAQVVSGVHAQRLVKRSCQSHCSMANARSRQRS